MKIIALPDLHTRGIALLETIASQLTAVDLVLLPGDLTNPGPIWKGHYAYAEIDDGKVSDLELREIR